MTATARIIANALIATLVLFLVHRYLIFWQDWPNVLDSFSILGSKDSALQGSNWQAITVILSLAVAFILVAWNAATHRGQSLLVESERYDAWAAYVIRFAFWSVFLVGIVDTSISALRIENMMTGITGAEFDAKLGQAKFRAMYFHYPLIALSAVIAALTKNLSMIWLALLVVLAEFSIVISRFVFSYEQAYMGDLVRFWYAALYLFAATYTLTQEGHVRVDVLYAGFSMRTKAWVNTLGSLLLGVPLCFTILGFGLGSRQSALASPIYSFEISQSAYGLFVKYLMAGFLIVYAVSMAIQFISYFLHNAAILLHDKDAIAAAQEGH